MPPSAGEFSKATLEGQKTAPVWHAQGATAPPAPPARALAIDYKAFFMVSFPATLGFHQIVPLGEMLLLGRVLQAAAALGECSKQKGLGRVFAVGGFFDGEHEEAEQQAALSAAPHGALSLVEEERFH